MLFPPPADFHQDPKAGELFYNVLFTMTNECAQPRLLLSQSRSTLDVVHMVMTALANRSRAKNPGQNAITIVKLFTEALNSVKAGQDASSVVSLYTPTIAAFVRETIGEGERNKFHFGTLKTVIQRLTPRTNLLRLKFELPNHTWDAFNERGY